MKYSAQKAKSGPGWQIRKSRCLVDSISIFLKVHVPEIKEKAVQKTSMLWDSCRIQHEDLSMLSEVWTSITFENYK